MAKKSDVKKVVKTAKKLHRVNPRVFYSVVAIVLVVAVVVGVMYALRPELFRGPMPQGEGELLVHFIDIGQGDCIYLELPNGKDMLIDAGSTKQSENEMIYVDGTDIGKTGADMVIAYLSRYNDDNIIDYVMVTHRDLDHISYMDEVFETFEIKNAYLPYDSGKVEYSKTYNKFEDLVMIEPNCTINRVIGDFNIDIGQDMIFDVYSIEENEYTTSILKEPNEYSPICILQYAGRKLVLTGDAENDSEQDFLNDAPLLLDCDILKVSHHGSDSSTPQEFLDRVKVEYAVISAGNSSYGHPHQVILDRLHNNNIVCFCTKFNGNILLTINNVGDISFKCAKGNAC